MSAYIHTPAQSRELARLHETAIYPSIYPDGSLCPADDIKGIAVPWVQVKSSGNWITVSLRNYSAAHSANVEITERGRVVEYDADLDTYWPVTVQWRQDPRWPALLWKLTVEVDWPAWLQQVSSLVLIKVDGRWRLAAFWNHRTGFLPEGQAEVRDLITGDIHVVSQVRRVEAHGDGWLADVDYTSIIEYSRASHDNPCPMCGSRLLTQTITEFHVECPAHTDVRDHATA